MSELDTVAEANSTSQPLSLNISQGGAGSEGYLKVQATLKPFVLEKTSSPHQFRQWTQIMLLKIDGFLKGWILNITPLKGVQKIRT